MVVKLPLKSAIFCDVTTRSTTHNDKWNIRYNRVIPASRHQRHLRSTASAGDEYSKNNIYLDVDTNSNIVIKSKDNFTISGAYNTDLRTSNRLAKYEIEVETNGNRQTNVINNTSVTTCIDPGVFFNDTSATSTSTCNESIYGNTTFTPPYNLPRLSVEIQIAFYAIIFVLAFVGNLLIIITLIQNKRMRTVTNVFLLNLAISDMLLALVCMPFTLVPVILMDFIFGKFMCVFIRYLQAVSVGVSCFTLVAISLERYFAICRPLHSRSWQTLSHAYRCIVVCWVLAGALMTPVAIFQKHIALENGAHMCREIWPNVETEHAYTVLLDLTLLVLPVIIMSVAYSRVVHALIFDVRDSMDLGVSSNGTNVVMQNYRTIELRLLNKDSCRSVSSFTSTDTSFSGTITPPKNISRSGTVTTPPTIKKAKRSAGNRIRHSNPTKIRQNKMRVIRMLFVVVLEFFICWTPVYLLQTWMVFHVQSAYQVFTPLTKTLFHLLSYVSSCCNPITYCFMNKKFREAFLRVFQCRAPPQSLRERRLHQLYQKRIEYQKDQKRRSTAVSRLSERFNPMASTTSMVLPEDSVMVAKPSLDKSKTISQSLDELDAGSSTD